MNGEDGCEIYDSGDKIFNVRDGSPRSFQDR